MAAGHNDRTMNRLRWLVLLLAALVTVAALAFPAMAAPKFPALTGRVTDAAGILSPDIVAALDTKLAALEAGTKTQLVVATVPDLQGLEIEDYGYRLGRAWGIGQKGQNNGVVLLVAPAERKVRIEVGYGLEGTLTDALTSQIIRREIIPYFKAGDMPGGIIGGTDALVKLLQLPADQQAGEAQAAAQAALDDQRASRGSGAGFGSIVWVVIIIVWLLISVLRGARGQRRGSSIIWGPGLGGWGGGDGGGRGWGGGGGGFGGGGGGFGGGGSSGSW